MDKKKIVATATQLATPVLISVLGALLTHRSVKAAAVSAAKGVALQQLGG